MSDLDKLAEVLRSAATLLDSLTRFMESGGSANNIKALIGALEKSGEAPAAPDINPAEVTTVSSAQKPQATNDAVVDQEPIVAGSENDQDTVEDDGEGEGTYVDHSEEQAELSLLTRLEKQVLVSVRETKTLTVRHAAKLAKGSPVAQSYALIDQLVVREHEKPGARALACLFPGKPLSEFTAIEVAWFMQVLKRCDYVEARVKRYRQSVFVFFEAAHKQGVFERNLAEGLVGLHRPKKQVRECEPTDAAIEQALEEAQAAKHARISERSNVMPIGVVSKKVEPEDPVEPTSSSESPSKAVVIEAREDREPRFLSKDAVIELMTMPDLATAKGVRDRLLIELQLRAALEEDVRQMALTQWLLSSGEVKFKHRNCVIGKPRAEAVRDYLKRWRGNVGVPGDAESNPHLFASENRAGECMLRLEWEAILREYAARSKNIPANILPEDLAHTGDKYKERSEHLPNVLISTKKAKAQA